MKVDNYSLPTVRPGISLNVSPCPIVVFSRHPPSINPIGTVRSTPIDPKSLTEDQPILRHGLTDPKPDPVNPEHVLLGVILLD